MISIMFALLAGYALDVGASASLSQSTELFDGIGSCGGQGRRVDMRKVAFLENRSIDVGAGRDEIRVRINDQNVYIQSISGNVDGPVNVHNAALAVQRDGDIDIDLKLALFEGGLLVYWRETFQHRVYRQGLLRPEPGGLVPLCEGQGGFNRSE